MGIRKSFCEVGSAAKSKFYHMDTDSAYDAHTKFEERWEGEEG